jgi:lysyl-tRNA synthetase class 1
LSRAYQLSAIDGKTDFQSTLLTLAQWVQMPNMEDEIKKADATHWATYAKVWVEKYAPESEKFIVQKEMPEQVNQLGEKQKIYLQKISEILEETKDSETQQVKIYEIAKGENIPSKDAFAAVYISLLGKNHGPKAAALIASLDKAFVKKRFVEASKVVILGSKATPESDSGQARMTGFQCDQTIDPEIFSIDKKVGEIFPSVSVGVAIIKNVTIEKTNEQLEKEKETLLASLEHLTTEALGQYPEIMSYRKLYKAMGVDWHSRRPSPEALKYTKKGLYTVNTCVDAYNLVVMKHRVSVGAFDLDTLKMPTELRFPKEGEEILLLGDSEPTRYTEKELAYFDQNGGFNIDFNIEMHKNRRPINKKSVYQC